MSESTKSTTHTQPPPGNEFIVWQNMISYIKQALCTYMWYVSKVTHPDPHIIIVALVNILASHYSLTTILYTIMFVS